MKRPRPRPRYADVTATLALVIALGGTTYAAVTITGKNVRDRSLTGADIRANSIRSAQVAGLRAKDFLRGQLPNRGPRGSTGPAGPTGPVGAAGSALAYASVAANGVVDSAHSAGIGMRSTGDGTYCIDYTGGAVNNFQLTLRWFTVGQLPLSGRIEGTADPTTINEVGCPAGTDVLALTATTGLADLPFYIAIIA